MRYDVITVRGGLAGAALARALALAGMRVLVLERETRFRDRVRGEEMHCWGVGETRALGIYDLLKSSCARESRYWSVRVHGMPMVPPRDLVATSPHRCGTFSVLHPAMQEVLLEAAAAAGADVLRGAQVTGVEGGRSPTVRARIGAGEQIYAARLVVGADGRDSVCRSMAGFEVERDADGMLVAGVLLDGAAAPDDTTALFVRPDLGQLAIMVPVAPARTRAYVASAVLKEARALSGRGRLPAFIGAGIAAGVPAGWLDRAEAAGPLACFDGSCRWVAHPYRDGVALVGDAAGATDPTFGCGLSLTLRDGRVLRDRLLEGEDWDAAAHAYATEHDEYFGAIHRLTGWMRALFYDPSEAAASVRARALPLIAAEPDRRPDIVGLGPAFPSDETARRRFFGEI